MYGSLARCASGRLGSVSGFSQTGPQSHSQGLDWPQTYLPVIDLLEFLDLPYSESASVGFVQITNGRNRLRLAKDDSQVMANDRKIALSAPVTIVKNQWLVPVDFLTKALDRTLDERIAISASGKCSGGGRI
jgi:hypothetical protein